MQTLILNGDSASELRLIAEIAKKLGLKAKILTEEEKEEIGMLKAIKSGRTKKYTDTDSFVNSLRKSVLI